MLRVYSLTLTVPANTPESKPVESLVEVEGKVLKRVVVCIPPGHCGLARFALYYGITPILPCKNGMWIYGDDETLIFDVGWPLPESRCELTAKGWNEDDTYEHMFIVRLEVAEEVEEAKPYKVFQSILNYLRDVFG